MSETMDAAAEAPRPRAEIEGGEIVIRVPVAALAEMVEGITESEMRVTDASALAVHVVAHLNTERLGTTDVEDLIEDQVSAVLSSDEPVPGVGFADDGVASGATAAFAPASA